MQATADDRIASLERRIDQGFAQVAIDIRTEVQSAERALRSEITSASNEARADYSTLVAVVFGLWATTVLGFASVLVTQL